MTIHRPPNQSSEVDEGMFFFMNGPVQNKKALIAGDFDIPVVDWDELSVNGSRDSFSSSLLKLTVNLHLFQNFALPTRIEEAQTANCVDLVLSMNPIDANELRSIAPLGKSEHAILLWEYEVNSKQTKNTEVRLNYWHGKFPAMEDSQEGYEGRYASRPSAEKSTTASRHTW
ncbi:unnamed protein product [Dibothriocephalus latus]|uniref:Endonuclease/exonuclease/phosphatase domain-containing protein n=1 Tax=Dibothriocephalus latus TaxID=60516 RepID=A0A3P7LIZ9_DIBLA|nr:unnamed protein product [Dibothriocephalus latus]